MPEVDTLEFWKSEAERCKKQMEVNLRVLILYEDTLTKIALMCGWAPPASPEGCPENIEDTAIRLVNKLTQK